MECSLGISNFLAEISSLSILLFSSISLHWSLREDFSLSLLFFRTLHSNGYIFPFLLCLLLLFFSQLFVRPPQTTIWLLAFLFLGDGLDPSLLYIFTNLCPQSFRQSIDLIPWIYLSFPLYNLKGFDLGHTWMVWRFSLLSSISVWIWQ